MKSYQGTDIQSGLSICHLNMTPMVWVQFMESNVPEEVTQQSDIQRAIKLLH